jgi:hypothetical protein
MFFERDRSATDAISATSDSAVGARDSYLYLWPGRRIPGCPELRQHFDKLCGESSSDLLRGPKESPLDTHG